MGVSLRSRKSPYSLVPTSVTGGHAKFQLELVQIMMKINMYVFRTLRILSTDRPARKPRDTSVPDGETDHCKMVCTH